MRVAGWLWVAACAGPTVEVELIDDIDDDGFSIDAGDCDDLDAAIGPEADESCDGVDQDCDGTVDDAPVDGTTWYADDDGDGYGGDERTVVACARPDGFRDEAEDCDDTDERVNPAAEDTTDEDLNCDGEIDGPEIYDGPISIDDATVSCNGNTVIFTAETVGWTNGGVVFSQETGNGDAAYPQWSDEHDLPSIERADDRSWDYLEQRLQDGSTLNDPLNDWRRNVSTLFQCEAHFEVPQIMSYAVAVFDANNALADCIAFGDDPTGLVNGRYNRVTDPSFATGSCQGVPAL